MSEIYVTEVPEAPQRENRFLTFFGSEYSGIKSLQFVPMSRVIRTVNGVLQGDKQRSVNHKIVDDIQQAIKDGYPDKWLGSARVLRYLPANKKFEVVYVGKEQEVKQVEPEVPKCFLAFDGTWRKTPTTGFTKGAREWAYVFACVDSTNVGRTDRFNGKTRLDCVQQLFESPIPWIQGYVRSLPFADPSEIPAPPAPVVERVYTEAELAGVPPLDPTVFQRMPSPEFKRKYAFDELFRVAYDKMIEVEEAQKAKDAERNTKVAKEAELKKMREDFLKQDADEARKGRVGTIL